MRRHHHTAARGRTAPGRATTPAARRRLVYFDHWTIGIHNFARLHEGLTAAGVDAFLLHAGSWRQSGAPAVERISGIDTYDISSFGTRLVYRALDRLRPDAVLMLNTSLMIERATIMACRKLGIRTIYLQHGILPDFASFAAIVTMQDPTYKQSRLARSTRYLRYYVPNYLFSGTRLDHRFLLHPSVYRYFHGLFSHPTQYLFYPPPSVESRCDRALVYANKDRDIHIKAFGYSPSAVTVVGNPNLDAAATPKYASRAELLRYHGLADRPYALYLDDGFPTSDYAGWTDDLLKRHLTEMETLCRQAGLHLIIKLHPQTARHAGPDEFSFLQHSTVLAEASVAELARYCDTCVGHISTTLRLPILMGKPVLVPRWGMSAPLPKFFGPAIVSYCETPSDFVRLLQQHDITYDRQQYIDDELTLADGRATERIVRAIGEEVR